MPESSGKLIGVELPSVTSRQNIFWRGLFFYFDLLKFPYWAHSSAVERFSDKEEVEGSTPSVPTKRACSSVVERRICNAEIEGSTPSGSTKVFHRESFFVSSGYV